MAPEVSRHFVNVNDRFYSYIAKSGALYIHAVRQNGDCL